MSAIQGAGLGLRLVHFDATLDGPPEPVWFEVTADDFLMQGGLNRQLVAAIANRYPTALHGVSLSLGGTHPLAWDYLAQVKELNTALGAHW